MVKTADFAIPIGSGRTKTEKFESICVVAPNPFVKLPLQVTCVTSAWALHAKRNSAIMGVRGISFFINPHKQYGSELPNNSEKILTAGNNKSFLNIFYTCKEGTRF
jgi:hypothetical protein